MPALHGCCAFVILLHSGQSRHAGRGGPFLRWKLNKLRKLHRLGLIIWGVHQIDKLTVNSVNEWGNQAHRSAVQLPVRAFPGGEVS